MKYRGQPPCKSGRKGGIDLVGEKYSFQPLTKRDKITVVLYRAGIVMSAVIIAAAGYMLLSPPHYQGKTAAGLLLALYISVGLSVFFIHLYVSKFHRALKRLYYVSIAALAVLFIIGKGDASEVLVNRPYGPLLLVPLSGCLGFVTAKEAFCFRLTEGYILAVAMPLYLLLAGGMTLRGASFGLLLIALLMLLFTLRKVFMPIHNDIGDKSAYQ